MRHWSLVFALLLAIVAGSAGSIAAQEATPAGGESPFAGLNATPLPLTVTGDGSVELPAELPAGRYELILDNPTDLTVDLVFVLAPTGAGAEELQATPAADETGLPGWYYDVTLAGGVSADAQATGRAVVDLTPTGNWAVWISAQAAEADGTPVADAAPREQLHPLSVTGEATPAAGAVTDEVPTIELVDFDFTVPDGLRAGPQVWKVTNAGERPHHLVLLRSADPITEGRVEQALQIEFGVPGTSATPESGDPADAAAPATLENVAYAQVLSPGRSEWISVDLEPGYYVLICFVPDAETGQPHALQRMIEVVEIGQDDTPGVATPAS